MSNLENYKEYNKIEVGIDEAGLGSVAGSFFVAAVILPKQCPDIKDIKLWNSIKDSKKLSKKKRYILADYIKDICIDYAFLEVTNKQVDSSNILIARLASYHRVLDKLLIMPDSILIDGDKFEPYVNNDGIYIPHTCIIGGDNKYKSIAAASILAKTEKDNHIFKIDKEYPEYFWKNNNGYLTKIHNEKILKYGITPYHRKTFGICKQWRKLPQIYI